MTDTTALTVLKMLAKGRGFSFVAQATGLPGEKVRQIADEHGVISAGGDISLGIAGTAAAWLEGELDREATAAIPTRTAQPVRPTPPVPLSVAGPDQTLAQVPLERLRIDPANPREDVADITELAASMREVGLLQPIVARRTAAGQLYVVAGHRRLAAARHLGWKSVAVVIRRDMRTDEVLAAMLIENGQRRDLDPIEEARGLARLKGQLRCTDLELARRIGRGPGHVARRLHLLSLPIEEQEALRGGQMSLQEATHKARLASGRLPSGTPRGMTYLCAAHPLAQAAKARCLRLGHSRGRGKGVGGIACGECWESVIRADERSHLHERSGATGKCALCDHPTPTRKDRPA